MKWINFLHCYQPVHMDAHFIKEATDKSYARIIKALEENPEIKFTLNINGCLFLRWEELGYNDLIKRIRKLLEKKQIELTGSACYHPLLPLVPKKEVVRQIDENEEILKKHFGDLYKPKGFFMPEMAYGKDVAKIVKDKGYKWIILDEIAYKGKVGDLRQNICIDKNSKLKVIFRDRKSSNTYIPKTVLKAKDSEHLLITASDGELYGLRYEDPTGSFEKSLKKENLKTYTVSDYINKFSDLEIVDIKQCNWESTEEEVEKELPYMSWYNENKKIQMRIWELANLSYNVIERHQKDENYYWARWHMVRGYSSCTFWWASEKDFSYNYGPYAWNPDEIERGINEFIRSIRALEDVTTRRTKVKAEKLFLKIKKMVWEKHWTYFWKNKK